MLFQAVANLLDKAIKYTPPQGRIEERLAAQEGCHWVSIADSDPGMPEAEQEKVFRRFYRLEKRRGLPGNDLELSLVGGALARLQKVALRIEDNASGRRVVMQFPRSSE